MKMILVLSILAADGTEIIRDEYKNRKAGAFLTGGPMPKRR